MQNAAKLKLTETKTRTRAEFINSEQGERIKKLKWIMRSWALRRENPFFSCWLFIIYNLIRKGKWPQTSKSLSDPSRFLINYFSAILRPFVLEKSPLLCRWKSLSELRQRSGEANNFKQFGIESRSACGNETWKISIYRSRVKLGACLALETFSPARRLSRWNNLGLLSAGCSLSIKSTRRNVIN